MEILIFLVYNNVIYGFFLYNVIIFVKLVWCSNKLLYSGELIN